MIVRKTLLLVTAALLLALPAAAQVRGTISGPGHTTFPIAIVPPKGPDGDAAGREFAETLARDLDLSGLFRVLPAPLPDRRPRDSGVVRERIDFGAWESLGARLLVKGVVGREDGEFVLAVRLFDVREREQIGGKKYIGRREDVQRIADRFADRVILLTTGEEGPFDSSIAFVSTREGGFKEIWVARADGTQARQITRNRTINLSPNWSPSADTLLFTSYRDGRPRLYEVDIDGGRLRAIPGEGGLVVGGEFAPDGRAIAVAREQTPGNSEVLIVNPAGEVLRVVTRDRGIDISPSWSPDGRRVVFCSSRGGTPQIYIASLQSGAVERITFEGSYNTSPAWSPAGDRIAYTGRVAGRFQIFVLELASREVHQVTSAAGDSTSASWSPDGRYLVFASTRSGRGEIYLSDWRGLAPRRLITTGGDDSSPSWSPRRPAEGGR